MLLHFFFYFKKYVYLLIEMKILTINVMEKFCISLVYLNPEYLVVAYRLSRQVSLCNNKQVLFVERPKTGHLLFPLFCLIRLYMQ